MCWGRGLGSSVGPAVRSPEYVCSAREFGSLSVDNGSSPELLCPLSSSLSLSVSQLPHL